MASSAGLQCLAKLCPRLSPAVSACSQRGFSSVGYGELKPIIPLPDNEYERKAVIYKPSGPTAQYGYDQKHMHGGMTAKWKVRLPAQEMWVNPLMGWGSSADTAESAFHKMTFRTPDEAAKFLEKQGIPYEVEEKSPNFERTYRPKRFYQYGDNFSTKRGGTPDLSTMPSNRSKK